MLKWVAASRTQPPQLIRRLHCRGVRRGAAGAGRRVGQRQAAPIRIDGRQHPEGKVALAMNEVLEHHQESDRFFAANLATSPVLRRWHRIGSLQWRAPRKHSPDHVIHLPGRVLCLLVLGLGDQSLVLAFVKDHLRHVTVRDADDLLLTRPGERRWPGSTPVQYLGSRQSGIPCGVPYCLRPPPPR